MGRKLLICAIIAAMLLQPAAGFADDTKANPYGFTANGTTYYEINDGKEIKDKSLDALVKQTIYGKPAGQKYSLAEYWADVAAGIIAGGPYFYASSNDHEAYRGGGNRSRYIFLEHPQSGENKNTSYMDLYADLATAEGVARYQNEDVGSGHGGDIYTMVKGFQKGSSIDDVYVAVNEGLASINKGDVKAADFKKGTSDQIPKEFNKTINGPVYYNLIVSRDLDTSGKGWYAYNAYAIVYSDFQLHFTSGKNGEGVELPAGIGKDGKTLDDALEELNEGVEYEGLANSPKSTVYYDVTKNEGEEEVVHTFTETYEEKKDMTSTVAYEREFNNVFGLNTGVEAGVKYVFTAKAGIDLKVEVDSTTGNGTSSSASGSRSTSIETEIPIPPHTNVQTITETDTNDITMIYRTPVEISYKVTILGFIGHYIDHNEGSSEDDPFLGYPDAFVVQFGGGGIDAREALNAWWNTGDDSAALIKAVRKELYLWDKNPMETSVSRYLVEEAADENRQTMKEKGRTIPGFDETIKALTTRKPYSLFGATLKQTGEVKTVTVGKPMSLYPLDAVEFVHESDRTVTIDGDELDLSDIELRGVDGSNRDFDFYHFNPDYGDWKIVDKKGNVLKNSEFISLEEDDNGDYILQGLKKTEKKAPAYIKYFVMDQKYHYRPDNKNIAIMQDDVDTPTIAVTVKNPTEEDDDDDEDEPDAANSAGEANDASEADSAGAADEAPAVTISEEERAEILGTLSCDRQYCSIAHAALFVKNHIGAQSTANERIYTQALMQLAADEMDSNDQQEQLELDAVIWAKQEGLMNHIERCGAYSGITELEFAQLAYNTAVKYGEDVSCDDLISQYNGSEGLDETQKVAMNWAISRGILSDQEESSKTLDPGRPMTDDEAAAFCR